jgi:glutaredoxin-like protein
MDRIETPSALRDQPTASEDNAIIVYGTDWCGDCHRTRRFLDRNQIFYQWIDADADPRASALVRALNKGRRSVPTLVFPDGSVMVEPSNLELARKLRISTGVVPSVSPGR